MSPNGGDHTQPPPGMAGALVLMALFLLFAIGVGVGFLIGRATA